MDEHCATGKVITRMMKKIQYSHDKSNERVLQTSTARRDRPFEVSRALKRSTGFRLPPKRYAPEDEAGRWTAGDEE